MIGDFNLIIYITEMLLKYQGILAHNASSDCSKSPSHDKMYRGLSLIDITNANKDFSLGVKLNCVGK